jgi:DnaJ family protein C protein 8
VSRFDAVQRGGARSVCCFNFSRRDHNQLFVVGEKSRQTKSQTKHTIKSTQPPATLAMTDQPSLSTVAEDWQIQRDHHKALGDDAFKCQGFKTAIGEYTKAISLDDEYLVLYSNRSAAYLKNNEKSRALKDAEKVIQLDPKYAKGHSRLAAALHSLMRFSPAKMSYQKVLELDPNNAVAKKGVEDCQRELERIEKEEQERRSTYEEEENQPHQEEQQEQTKEEPPAGEVPVDEDDLLNDFFDDVEESTKKKTVHAKAPVSTNAIKNQKEVLGTFESQVERLLCPNYEWRNLNSFYVLKLPSDAPEEDISRRYKALSLLLHPDKNGGSELAQLAYDQVQKAKNILSDPDRAKHTRLLMEEGMKQGKAAWDRLDKKRKKEEALESLQEKEVMRIFAQVEQKRREVEQRERNYEQRERQQEDEASEKERQSRQFDKQWRNEKRVDKRVGNWRDFSTDKKKKT